MLVGFACEDKDETVSLWGVEYSIETTDRLYLSVNQLTGEIPPEIGNLTNLTQLYLSGNQLTGEIPPEIGNLTNLTHLGLDNNHLTGSIPQEIKNLTNLIFILFGNNHLTGEIPNGISYLTKLSYLSLRNNQLTGIYSICNLTTLTNLHLFGNKLYCEDGEQNTDLIPQFVINFCDQFSGTAGLYDQNCYE